MSADITPEKARLETIENLADMANLYRVGTGAHTVVIEEINRRAEVRKNWRKVTITVLLGSIGLLFWWLRTYLA
jgi:hypothetical protein